jgi:hypothetical protein
VRTRHLLERIVRFVGSVESAYGPRIDNSQTNNVPTVIDGDLGRGDGTRGRLVM